MLRKKVIELVKQQQTRDADAEENADASQLGPDFPGVAVSNAQMQEAQAVPVPDAVRGPAHVARQHLIENTWAEIQKDADALVALW